jgi:peptidoglycan/xylan/chitin deacetylase (PgdA/CDA1 family)
MSSLNKLVLHAIEYLGGFGLLRYIHKQSPTILMYHRIYDDEYINGIPPLEFEKQIAYLSKHFNILPIEQLIQDFNNNRVKPYSLALTFDDGHHDFYTNAWPILKKYNLPASLYITTGFVDGTTWLWPDLLKYILLNSKIDRLSVATIGSISTAKKEHVANWHKLGDYCLSLKVDERNKLLLQLAEDAQVSVSSVPQPPFHSVTWPQLQTMSQEGLVVGSHTVTHPILSTLATEALRSELTESAKAIERNLGVIPTGICYPNGRSEDINKAVITEAVSAGYTYGLMGRNMKLNITRNFKIGRLAANKDFFYFKWTLARRKQEMTDSYLQ